MTDPLETVIRAACGDAQAPARVLHAYDRDVDLLTAVVLTDPAPHPPAAIAAPATQERPSQALRFIARRAPPAAAGMPEQDACADLRSKLVWHLSRVWNALAAPSDPESIAACARLARAMNAAADFMERIGAEGWGLASPETCAAARRSGRRSTPKSARALLRRRVMLSPPPPCWSASVRRGGGWRRQMRGRRCCGESSDHQRRRRCPR